jgi:hypothetical protein
VAAPRAGRGSARGTRRDLASEATQAVRRPELAVAQSTRCPGRIASAARRRRSTVREPATRRSRCGAQRVSTRANATSQSTTPRSATEWARVVANTPPGQHSLSRRGSSGGACARLPATCAQVSRWKRPSDGLRNNSVSVPVSPGASRRVPATHAKRASRTATTSVWIRRRRSGEPSRRRAYTKRGSRLPPGRRSLRLTQNCTHRPSPLRRPPRYFTPTPTSSTLRRWR